MQDFQKEIGDLIQEVVKTRLELIKKGLEKCGLSDEWFKDPENKKRCKFVENEGAADGFATAFYMDNKLMFEVICKIDHKTMTVKSVLRMDELRENEDGGSKEMRYLW